MVVILFSPSHRHLPIIFCELITHRTTLCDRAGSHRANNLGGGASKYTFNICCIEGI